MLTLLDSTFAMGSDMFNLEARPAVAVADLATAGFGDTARWRSRFAAGAMRTWAAKGTVWVTTRVLASRPEPAWNWVEGDDRRVSWQAIHDFYGQFEWGTRLGTGDGFIELRDTPQNRRILSEVQLKEGAR